MFDFGYNQGLKVACDAPSASLANLRAPKVDFDGKEVRYEEDDNLLPKNSLPLPSTKQEANPSKSHVNNDLVSSAPPFLTASITNSNGVEK